jgi:hypothetical protein
MISLCCHLQLQSEKGPDWAVILTAFATVALVLVAYFQLSDMRGAIKQYTFNAFLNQEKDLLSKQNVISNTASDLYVLSQSPFNKSIGDKIETLTIRRQQEITDYLTTFDRLAYGILHLDYPKDECRRTYRGILKGTCETYILEINSYPNILALAVLWNVSNND